MTGTYTNEGIISGKKFPSDEIKNNPSVFSYNFVADASDGSIKDITIPSGMAGFLFGADISFDGTTPPHNLTTIVKTRNGNTKWAPAKQTASGYLQPDSPVPLVAGDVIAFAQDATATNSAKAKVDLLIG